MRAAYLSHDVSRACVSHRCLSLYCLSFNAAQALHEEASASAAFFGDAGLVLQEASDSAEPVDWTSRPAADVIAEMRRPGSDINWATFTLSS